METGFDLSLLICTRNRAKQLAQTLQRVATIRTQLNWELIIVDNASTDTTVAVVEEFAATCHRSVQTIIQDPEVGFVGGRILLHDPTDRRITIQESLEPLSFPAGSFIRPGVIQGANIAYRRAALQSVGGFDPWFGAGAI